MSESKDKMRIEQIIRDYFYGNYGKGVHEHLRTYFDSWIVNDRDSAEKEETLKDIWSEIDLKPNSESKRLLKKAQKKVGLSPKIVPFRRVILRVAAVLIPAAIFAGSYLYFTNNIQSGDELRSLNILTQTVGLDSVMVVPASEVRELALADGSEIWINSSSKISCPEQTEKNERLINLEGESFFKVAKDETRPFVVSTAHTKVTVLGTQFNVEAYPDSEYTVVTLCSGKVNVLTQSNQKFELMPNQQLVISNVDGTAELRNLSALEASELTAWRNGEMNIDGITLSEIFDILGRRYNVQVDVVGETGEKIYYAKFYKGEKLEHIMTVLQTIIPEIDYKITGGRLEVTVKKK